MDEKINDKQLGLEFLNALYNDLHMSDEVMHRSKKSQKPTEKIENYIDALERTHNTNSKSHVRRLRKFYHDKYIIKPDNPGFEDYFERERRMAINDGYHIEDYDYLIDKPAEIKRIIREQKISLDRWLNYFLSPDSDYIPMWCKYWMFQGMLKLGKFNKDKKSFAIRNKETILTYPEINKEAIGKIVDYLMKHLRGQEAKKFIKEKSGLEKSLQSLHNRYETGGFKERTNENGELVDAKTQYDNQCQRLTSAIETLTKKIDAIGMQEIDDEKIKQLLSNRNFGKIYGHVLAELLSVEKEISASTDGQWVTFHQNSNHKNLVRALQGYSTGWCIANDETAKGYLAHGDIAIYFSKNALGKNRIPRICIRKEYDSLREVRGIALDQEVEAELYPILEKKLDEYPDKEEYLDKISNMKIVRKLYDKYKNEELSDDELKFIIENFFELKGFGGLPPQLSEIIYNSKIVYYLSNLLFNFKKDDVVFDSEAFNNLFIFIEDKYDYVKTKLNESFIENNKELLIDMILISLTSAKNINFEHYYKDTVHGDLSLYNLETADGIVFPKNITGNLELTNLTHVNNVTLPEKIGKNLYLDSLITGEGLVGNTIVADDLFVQNIKSLKTLPSSIKTRGLIHTGHDLLNYFEFLDILDNKVGRHASGVGHAGYTKYLSEAELYEHDEWEAIDRDDFFDFKDISLYSDSEMEEIINDVDYRRQTYVAEEEDHINELNNMSESEFEEYLDRLAEEKRSNQNMFKK